MRAALLRDFINAAKAFGDQKRGPGALRLPATRWCRPSCRGRNMRCPTPATPLAQQQFDAGENGPRGIVRGGRQFGDRDLLRRLRRNRRSRRMSLRYRRLRGKSSAILQPARSTGLAWPYCSQQAAASRLRKRTRDAAKRRYSGPPDRNGGKNVLMRQPGFRLGQALESGALVHSVVCFGSWRFFLSWAACSSRTWRASIAGEPLRIPFIGETQPGDLTYPLALMELLAPT